MGRIKVCMIVDDDLDDQELFELSLGEVDSSIRLITANNGSDALDYLRGDAVHPEIIFLDLNMPRMNGKECLHHLKSDEMLSDIPVVIFSTSSDPRDKKETISNGAMDFITKPARTSELTKLLTEILSRNIYRSIKPNYEKRINQGPSA
jgi:CheY-like chemotaxis protein